MKNSTQVVGVSLLVVAIILGILIAAWLGAGLAEESLQISGAVLGGVVACMFLVLPFSAVGAFLVFKGRQEASSMERVSRQRKMLGIIEAAGEISIPDLALEMDGTRDSVREDLYDLVSKGLFSGYVDWDRGRLFSLQASEIRSLEDHCPNCGAELSLAGKGVIRCNFCGSEVFLP